MAINWATTDEDRDLIGRIVDRAANEAYPFKMYGSREDLAMDLTACHLNGTPLDLQKLLDADGFTFAHDIYGIADHLDRTNGTLQNLFLPRCSAKRSPAGAVNFADD